MAEFFDELTSSKWWIGVVVVGILINILSSFLYKWITKVRARISDKTKYRNEKQIEYQKKQIEYLRKNPHEKYLIGLDEMKFRIWALSWLILGLLFLFLSKLAVDILPQVKKSSNVQFGFAYSFVIICGLGAMFCLLTTIRASRMAQDKANILRQLKQHSSDPQTDDIS